MKRICIIIITLVCAFTLVMSSALADKSTSGLTSGGNLGKATGYGELDLTNSTSAGQDKVAAKTKSNISGSGNSSSSTLYYVKGSGSGSVTVRATSNGTTWATATAKPSESNAHGYKGVTAHAVTLTGYGAWSASLSEEW